MFKGLSSLETVVALTLFIGSCLHGCKSWDSSSTDFWGDFPCITCPGGSSIAF